MDSYENEQVDSDRNEHPAMQETDANEEEAMGEEDDDEYGNDVQEQKQSYLGNSRRLEFDNNNNNRDVLDLSSEWQSLALSTSVTKGDHSKTSIEQVIVSDEEDSQTPVAPAKTTKRKLSDIHDEQQPLNEDGQTLPQIIDEQLLPNEDGIQMPQILDKQILPIEDGIKVSHLPNEQLLPNEDGLRLPKIFDKQLLPVEDELKLSQLLDKQQLPIEQCCLGSSRTMRPPVKLIPSHQSNSSDTNTQSGDSKNKPTTPFWLKSFTSLKRKPTGLM